METISATTQDDSSGANPSSVKSDDSSPQHDSGRGSPPPYCAICLGTCKNKSFTDSCLHQFCFKCLLTWSRVKAECPLCKQNFRSIIHNVRSNHQYEEYMVEQRQAEGSIERLDMHNLTANNRRFRYRTTLTLPRRETIAIQQLLLHHYPIMADFIPTPNASAPPPAPRRRSPAAFRRTVYRHNLWARPLPDFTGRFRDCSPEFFRYNDSQTHRLVPWLNRELYYLLNENIGHIAYVITRILELLPQFHINSTEFREAVQVYFRDRTEHFLHELYCFASTPYDMTGYDRNVQYTTDTRVSTMINEVVSSSESDATVDSDIVMVSSSEPAEPPPGPSRPLVSAYSQGYTTQPARDNVISIETISQSDSDDDSSEVMVVGYIKPPQDRTPEVVDLLGSDSDVIVQETSTPEEPQPQTSEGSDGSRAVPLVKLILKRHAMQGNPDSDDSDDRSYTPPPPTRRKRRHKSNDTATTSDTSRTTPSLSPPSTVKWEIASSSSDTEISSYSSSNSSLISSTSDTDTLRSEISDGKKRKNIKKRKYKRKHKETTYTSSEKKKGKNLKRKNQKESQAAQLEKENNCKRKSNSGKGVKSSKKNVISNSTQEQGVALHDEPSTSYSNSNNKYKSKSRQRSHLSRENRRLKSVVNVMRHQNSCGEASTSGNSSIAAFAVTSSSGKDSLDDQNVQLDSTTSAVPSTSRNIDSNSVSDDDLPLNLTIQKTYMSL